jgi:hypothetical protein
MFDSMLIESGISRCRYYGVPLEAHAIPAPHRPPSIDSSAKDVIIKSITLEPRYVGFRYPQSCQTVGHKLGVVHFRLVGCALGIPFAAV